MLLEVQQLEKVYRKRRSTVTAVDGVSFQLDGGKILGFLGPNGAGKSTTIKMIAGLIAPDSGDAVIAGESVLRHRGRALRHVGAVLEGSRNLYWRLSPLENLQYWAGMRGVSRREALSRARELLDLFELSDKQNNTVQQLSRGMQQKVAICAALIHRPSLLLLDEPTLGLDLESSDRIQRLVLELAHEQKIGVVLTTHQMEVAEALSDQIAIIQSGAIVLEGEKHDVLGRFAGNAYVVETSERIPIEVRKNIEADGAVFESDNSFRVAVTRPQDLYRVVDRLTPLPIIMVERDTADLATVFRHYTNGQVVETLKPTEVVENTQIRPSDVVETEDPSEVVETARPSEVVRAERRSEAIETARPSEVVRAERRSEAIETAQPVEVIETSRSTGAKEG